MHPEELEGLDGGDIYMDEQPGQEQYNPGQDQYNPGQEQYNTGQEQYNPNTPRILG